MSRNQCKHTPFVCALLSRGRGLMQHGVLLVLPSSISFPQNHHVSSFCQYFNFGLHGFQDLCKFLFKTLCLCDPTLLQFIDGGRHWTCNMCGMNNGVESDFFCTLDAQVHFLFLWRIIHVSLQKQLRVPAHMYAEKTNAALARTHETIRRRSSGHANRLCTVTCSRM